MELKSNIKQTLYIKHEDKQIIEINSKQQKLKNSFFLNKK